MTQAPEEALERLIEPLARRYNVDRGTLGVKIIETKNEIFIFFSDQAHYNRLDYTDHVDNFFTVLNFDEDLPRELNRIPESLHKATRKYIIGTSTGSEKVTVNCMHEAINRLDDIDSYFYLSEKLPWKDALKQSEG